MNRFTVRIKPYLGEALSSFLFRLSKANRLQLISLLNNFKVTKAHYIQRNDINLLDFSPYSLVDLKRLSEMNNIQEKEMLQLSFYFFLKKFRSEKEIQRARFISGMVRDHFCYCPKCLLEKQYFPLLWKIENIIVCTKHGIPLVDSCATCNKEVKLENQYDLSLCPNCSYPLTDTLNELSIFDETLKYQVWLEQSWNILFNSTGYNLDSEDIAIRVLYILNSYQPKFHRGIVESNMKEPKSLPTLLQHARGTLSQERTLHLSYILRILYENDISMEKFLGLSVKESFINSIRGKTVLKSDQFSCMAPWCANYGKLGLMIKTGTSFKRLDSGEILTYYLACLECGCEYAVNQFNELEERTSFIEGYRMLKDIVDKTSINKLSRKTGLPGDKVKRHLAYFHSRGIIEYPSLFSNISDDFVKAFINGIRNYKTIKHIQAWECWKSYSHFLLHRYHPDVMREIIETKRPRQSKKSSNNSQVKVQHIVDQLFNADKEITIAAVSEIAEVCPETLRNWGCNPYIAKKCRKNTGYQ
ncbi:hypothetical protein GMD78_13135 [Ornithinibacillus sp. L9]|uniref:TniQ domain-containing protein n=1 Tax=Ornithinibacillus caprae TaxID=2678566 RepID=A0A6N8FKT3_9BACI|nr:TniQ family protein [Ornithinibacillus caprae]MUK89316.1 hypothetical protein [Ornithinibacillus caprae]